MGTVLIVLIIMIVLSTILFNNEHTPIQEIEIELDSDSSKSVQELYKCLQSGLISEEDLTVKLVINLSEQVLNSLNKNVNVPVKNIINKEENNEEPELFNDIKTTLENDIYIENILIDDVLDFTGIGEYNNEVALNTDMSVENPVSLHTCFNDFNKELGNSTYKSQCKIKEIKRESTVNINIYV